MSHTTLKSGYAELVDRLNRFPQGAPPSDTLFSILKILFDEKEARLVALLPIKPFTASHASQASGNWTWRRKRFSRTGKRAILVDILSPGGAPLRAAAADGRLLRVLHDAAARRCRSEAAGELFYQYINVEEEFITALFMSETRLGRAFVNEDVLLPGEQQCTVLDYERASEVVRSASTAASASAIAATRWRTCTAPATHRWTSA
jgi:hypothetical protein